MATILKVVLLGESGVGKTCIINRFTSGIYDPDVGSSISAQFISKSIEFKELKQTIKFDIWDTAGQERYKSLAKIFYKDAKVICLCYDITNKKSFIELKDYWYEQQTKLNANGEPIFAVVANKIDLYETQQVKDEDGKAFAKEIKGIFQATSAKSDFGINKLFENVGRRYFDPSFNNVETDQKERLEYEKKKIEKLQEKNQMNAPPRRGTKLVANKSKTEKKGKCC